MDAWEAPTSWRRVLLLVRPPRAVLRGDTLELAVDADLAAGTTTHRVTAAVLRAGERSDLGGVTLQLG